MRIDKDGLVGIGTDNPQESLHTSGNIRFGDTAPAEIYTNSSELRLGVDRNNDNGVSDMTFYADNSEKMRIDSSGHAIIPNGVTLGTAAGTYNAANTLDDYEEGTFTVAFEDSSGNAATLGNDYGYYTKVGRQVTIVVDIVNIDTTGLTSTDDIRITGLPFSVFGATGGPQFVGSCNCFDIGTSGKSVIAFIQDSINYIQLKTDDISISLATTLRVSDVNSVAADIRFSLTYFAA